MSLPWFWTAVEQGGPGIKQPSPRCDHPGCLSHVTEAYLVGLGGMPAFYCVDHAPASNRVSEPRE